MKAENTVMNWGQISEVLQDIHKGLESYYSTSDGLAVAKIQAEISFPISEKQGRQEVVEWFMAHGYSGGKIHYSDGDKARFDPPWDELQDKLKDWGL